MIAMTFDINTIADICRPHNEKLIAEGRADKLERENAKLRADNADMLAALKGLAAVIGKMKPASVEPYGQAVAELLEAKAAIAKAGAA